MAAPTNRRTRSVHGGSASAPARPPGASDDGAVPLPEGLLVRVRNRFEDRWVPGFAVAEHEEGRYRLRRCSDGHVLPGWFPFETVRPDEG